VLSCHRRRSHLFKIFFEKLKLIFHFGFDPHPFLGDQRGFQLPQPLFQRYAAAFKLPLFERTLSARLCMANNMTPRWQDRILKRVA